MRQDTIGEFFRTVAEQGHYAGRTKPTNTRQGLYACLPDGRLLASVNTTDPEVLLETIELALARLSEDEMPDEEFAERRFNQLEQAQGKHPGTGGNGESTGKAVTSDARRKRIDPVDTRYVRHSYPEDGLALKVFVRDLPRKVETRPDDWRRHAFNLDYAWFTKNEIDALFPKEVRLGDTYPAPSWFVKRLARFHFIDTVRGQAPPWPDEAVKKADLEMTVLSKDPCSLRLTGEIHLQHDGEWSIRGAEGPFERQSRGYVSKVYGEIVFDPESRKINTFELAAVGDRWGGTQYNFRWDDLDPAPMGIWIEVAGDSLAERARPAHVHAGYFLGAPGSASVS